MAQGMKRLAMPMAALLGVAMIGLLGTSWFLNRDALREAGFDAEQSYPESPCMKDVTQIDYDNVAKALRAYGPHPKWPAPRLPGPSPRTPPIREGKYPPFSSSVYRS